MLLYAFVVFAIFQTSLGLPTSAAPRPLDDLAEALPLNELRELKAKHLNDDPEFQAAVKYFHSPEWKTMIDDVRSTPQWMEYKNFMKEAGVDLDYYIQHFEHCLNASDVSKFKLDNVKPSLGKFLQDVKMTHGIDLLKAVHAFTEKMEKNENQKKMMEMMKSPKSKQLLEDALKQPALDKVVKKLKEMDVNVDYAIQMLYSFGGWEIKH